MFATRGIQLALGVLLAWQGGLSDLKTAVMLPPLTPPNLSEVWQAMLLDGDHTIYSNVWPHCSDLDQSGLPGTHEIFDCQYAAATDGWYSVRFDLEPASP